MRPAQLLTLSIPLLAALALGSCVKRAGDPSGGGPETEKPFAFTEKPASGITFLSTQLNPVEEAGKMRNLILKDYPGKVDFRPNDNSQVFNQIEEMIKSNPMEPVVIGASHGDFVSLYDKGALRPIGGEMAKLEARRFPETLVALSRLDGKNDYYVPWMQASFVFVANKKALAYLPKGAKLDSLSYDQLYEWAGAAYRKTGKRVLGFPAGKNGLMHRFFQGYLYPSFTASTLLKFRSGAARDMWAYFKGLWEYVQPGSLSYSSMSEPLLTEDVLIAWDHSARLVKALQEKPGDFVAFPAPKGPSGRGYMLIVAGLGVPRGARDTRDQETLIDYLTEPAIQARTLRETGFFPVVSMGDAYAPPAYLAGMAEAVRRQTESSEGVATLSPIGLGQRGADYNSVFMLTFSGIVLEGKDIARVLDANARELQGIVDEARVRCWLPDASDERPCKIE